MITPRESPTVETVGRHYDELDVYYRDIWGEHVHHGLWKSGNETPEQACEQLIRLAAEQAGIAEGSKVCDVGCGYGGTSRFLTREYGAHVTGVTVSQAQLEFARAQTNGDEYPRYLLQDWMTNEFPEASFDAVISIECLTHMPDKQRYFDEIARVLKPGKKAAIYCWQVHSSPRNWEVRRLLEPICYEGRLPGMGSHEEYRAMIESAGLEILRYDELGKHVRKTWWICARRLAGKLCTSRKYIKALFDSNNGNRVFALTLLRILTAYQTGAMEYGLYVLRKP
ncbi:MAG: methyltransferase domain-containing protein [Planctomycetota bacterium]|nr:MAG: methyltransferase domain-containing protein [Planctomycetota bacterium]REJ95735.1 MAG: methyltransferase domain-containing protein [Planctomycetota bacterium]REK23393.1 MAG: methyltransferase domain-containing protein [Planctomycetota bacterium]REK38970.1 MAG: methyltransferase domain-containing protein [Planctomycetota bacterium]